MIKIEALCTKNEDFDQTYSKTQNEKEVSLDLIFHYRSGKISKVLVRKTPGKELTLNRTETIKTNSVDCFSDADTKSPVGDEKLVKLV